MNPMIAMAIYGLSLSIVLDLLFDVIYVMTGFTVQYFNVIKIIYVIEKDKFLCYTKKDRKNRQEVVNFL